MILEIIADFYGVHFTTIGKILRKARKPQDTGSAG
jgi:hypothetical protein